MDDDHGTPLDILASTFFTRYRATMTMSHENIMLVSIFYFFYRPSDFEVFSFEIQFVKWNLMRR